MLKSRVQQPNFRHTALSRAEAQHRVLLAMAADAEKLRAQAERIKELREAKGRREGTKISQETAAHEIGVSVRQYRTWESTGADMMPENVKAAAAYYGTTVDYIERGEAAGGATPDLSTNGRPSLDQIDAKLDQILETLRNAEPVEDVVTRALAPLLELVESLKPPTANEPPMPPVDEQHTASSP